MNNGRFLRVMMMLGSGAMLLQAGACDTVNTINQFVQTALLGVTAAGAIAIIQEI